MGNQLIESGGRLTTAKTVDGASVIVRDGSRFLLVRRGNAPFEGHWSLPGGKIRKNEQPGEAATRELYEETGIAADALSLFTQVDVRSFDHGDAFKIHCFVATRWSGEPVAGDDADAVNWFSLTDVTGLPTTPGLSELLAKLDA